MRWSDLDQLNHVNNVVYVDYAEQARAALVEDGEVVAGPLSRVDVEFRRPLLLSRTPVLVRTEVDGGTTTHAIGPDGADQAFATVRLEAGALAPEPMAGAATKDGLSLRRSDLGADGTVTPTRLFELTQEARILSFATIVPDRTARFVVARVDLRLGEPVGWRTEPLLAETGVTHVGRSSFVTTTWFDGGRAGSATAVLVGFDLETQSSQPLDDAMREALTAAQRG